MKVSDKSVTLFLRALDCKTLANYRVKVVFCSHSKSEICGTASHVHDEIHQLSCYGVLGRVACLLLRFLDDIAQKTASPMLQCTWSAFYCMPE